MFNSKNTYMKNLSEKLAFLENELSLMNSKITNEDIFKREVYINICNCLNDLIFYYSKLEKLE